MNIKTLKLFNIPRGSKIKVEFEDRQRFITFNHLDGMYSHCTTDDGGVCHLFAGVTLKKENDYYIIDESNEN